MITSKKVTVEHRTGAGPASTLVVEAVNGEVRVNVFGSGVALSGDDALSLADSVRDIASHTSVQRRETRESSNA